MVPAAKPVTNPAPVTVATDVLLLLHTPEPVISLSVVVPPMQISVFPVIAATVVGALTVTIMVVEIDPHVFVMVYDIVTVFKETPVTTPAELTVATAVLLLLQVPPAVASVSTMVWPLHTFVVEPPIGVTVGDESMVTTTAAEVDAQTPWYTITVKLPPVVAV